jgi:hypothetical protein
MSKLTVISLIRSLEGQRKSGSLHYPTAGRTSSYKGPADLPKEIRRELAWIAASAWGADHAYKRVWDWQTGHRENDPS